MFKVPNKFRITSGILASTNEIGNNGAFSIPGKRFLKMLVVASEGMGWEHVSVSLETRTPKWSEMCRIKAMFWDEDDVVIQYHPAKKDYINQAENCLHLWRPIGIELPTPPPSMVGVKK